MEVDEITNSYNEYWKEKKSEIELALQNQAEHRGSDPGFGGFNYLSQYHDFISYPQCVE